jgi:hypothetical protein
MKSEVELSVARIRQRSWRDGAMPSRILLLLLCALIAPVSHASLIWDNNFGTQLVTANFLDQPGGSSNPSDGLQTVQLDPQYKFSFQGSTYDSIIVTTSGFVWLGASNQAQCCDVGSFPDTINNFEDGPPRIAPGWADLRPDAGGGIYFNEITDSLGSRTDITWANVATDPSDLANVTFQLQIYTNGQIIFSYLNFDSASLGPNLATMIGLTPLFGDPHAVDIFNLPQSSNSASVYDYLTTGGAGFNLDNQSIVFTPNGPGWNLTSTVPTPEPATFLPAGGIIFLLAYIHNKRKRALLSSKV